MNDKIISGGSPAWPIVIAVAVLAALGGAYWAYLPPAPVAPVDVATGSAVSSLTGSSAAASGATNSSGATASGASVGMANPASVNCVAKGGTVTVKRRPGGGEYGVCYFEDNRQCEEWAFLRGDCPYGGRRITGYDDDAEIFCAISGGTVHTENKPVSCELPDGAGSCSAAAFFRDGIACAKS